MSKRGIKILIWPAASHARLFQISLLARRDPAIGVNDNDIHILDLAMFPQGPEWVEQVCDLANNIILQPAIRQLWVSNFKYADEVSWEEWWSAFPKLAESTVGLEFLENIQHQEAFKVRLAD